jgi:hypothetical protein
MNHDLFPSPSLGTGSGRGVGGRAVASAADWVQLAIVMPTTVGGHLICPARMPRRRLPFPFQGPGLTRLWNPGYHVPEPESQSDKAVIKVRPTFEPLRRGVWTTSDFHLCTGC